MNHIYCDDQHEFFLMHSPRRKREEPSGILKKSNRQYATSKAVIFDLFAVLSECQQIRQTPQGAAMLQEIVLEKLVGGCSASNVDAQAD